MRTTKLFLLLLSAMMLGIGIGFFSSSLLIQARVQAYRQISPHGSEHILGKLTHRISLTEEQRRQVQSLLHTYDLQRATQRGELQLKLHRDISRCLPPEQREEYEKMWGRSEPPSHAGREETTPEPRTHSSHAE